MTKSKKQRFGDKQAARQYVQWIHASIYWAICRVASLIKRADYNFLDFCSNSSIAGSLAYSMQAKTRLACPVAILIG